MQAIEISIRANKDDSLSVCITLLENCEVKKKARHEEDLGYETDVRDYRDSDYEGILYDNLD